MITVDEARRLLLANAAPLGTELLRVQDTCGRFLAEDSVAPHGFPLFDMSAVDGYALGAGPGPWELVGSIAAGDVLDRSLRQAECARIFTGAMVPTGCIAILMQEHAELTPEGRIAAMKPIADGANIRRTDESFKKGSKLIEAGQRLNTAHIGLLASCGIEKVVVSAAPRVGVVRTGGEFREAGSSSVGKVFSSNDSMLIAAIRSAGMRTDDAAIHADDEPGAIRAALLLATSKSDAVITTGGVSVGEHDHMRRVLEELGATIHFHGVKQKPGKPMLFATLGRTPILALPGNPRAVMVCWHVHVLPFLQAMQGAASPGHSTKQLAINHDITLKGERTEFRAATVRAGNVHLLADEGSHMLGTLAAADALACLPEGPRTLQAGEMIEVLHLPRA